LLAGRTSFYGAAACRRFHAAKTFSDPLSFALERKLQILAADKTEIVPRITVASFEGAPRELYQLAFGGKPPLASEDIIRSLRINAASDLPGASPTERFPLSE
jgi:hypothetical protein